MSEPLRVGSDYWPVWACTYAGSRPIGPAALDCVRVIVIRSGSALLVGELGQRLVKTGDVVLLAANVCQIPGLVEAERLFCIQAALPMVWFSAKCVASISAGVW